MIHPNSDSQLSVSALLGPAKLLKPGSKVTRSYYRILIQIVIYLDNYGAIKRYFDDYGWDTCVATMVSKKRMYMCDL